MFLFIFLVFFGGLCVDVSEDDELMSVDVIGDEWIVLDCEMLVLKVYFE